MFLFMISVDKFKHKTSQALPHKDKIFDLWLHCKLVFLEEMRF